MLHPAMVHGVGDGGQCSRRVKLLQDFSLEKFLNLRLGACADDEGGEDCSTPGGRSGEDDKLVPVPMDLLLAAHRSRPKVERPESIPEDSLSLKGTKGKSRNIVKCRRRAAMQFLTLYACKMFQKNIMENRASSRHTEKSTESADAPARDVTEPTSAGIEKVTSDSVALEPVPEVEDEVADEEARTPNSLPFEHYCAKCAPAHDVSEPTSANVEKVTTTGAVPDDEYDYEDDDDEASTPFSPPYAPYCAKCGACYTTSG